MKGNKFVGRVIAQDSASVPKMRTALGATSTHKKSANIPRMPTAPGRTPSGSGSNSGQTKK